MPTYSYACTACDHRFDVQQSFSDASLTECPTCEGRLRKLFSSVGVVFKGSGFYRNDARAEAKGAKKKKPAAGAPATSTTTTESSSAGTGSPATSGAAASGSSTSPSPSTSGSTAAAAG